MTKKIIPQQYPGYPGTRPPKGWVPPLGQYLNLLGVYDNESGFWMGLPLQVLSEQLVLAEKQHTLDRVDIRNGQVSITVPIGTAVGASVTGEIEVPEGEIWYLRGHEIRIHQQAGLTAGDLICNFRVSRFPATDDAAKLFYNTNDRLTATQSQIAAGDVFDHDLVLVGAYWDGTDEVKVYREVIRDFADPDELGNALRLIGGDKLTLVVTGETAAIAGGAVTVDLTVWGLRGKRLVE
ncbi:hypothetical protein B1778_00745 [Dehalococcoides mccartyi]|uniref:hypothetical protein n=1 Tax=Dehalococcoides mccartyi TaxID=61435 RepID=UPI00098EDCEA|nr:hypothetical protein [Dehalococcoides mccartyi]AQU05300.1 hypothetical protein B1777_00890 [Dehalococcoides mccartyi]AQU06753.1 hypothetical protein B1778_00745 [Dehalococcoides mccartyi]